ncbi:hypothetical protein BH11PAT4_BH11PAT4_4350 [soil metagenome]
MSDLFKTEENPPVTVSVRVQDAAAREIITYVLANFPSTEGSTTLSHLEVIGSENVQAAINALHVENLHAKPYAAGEEMYRISANMGILQSPGGVPSLRIITITTPSGIVLPCYEVLSGLTRSNASPALAAYYAEGELAVRR